MSWADLRTEPPLERGLSGCSFSSTAALDLDLLREDQYSDEADCRFPCCCPCHATVEEEEPGRPCSSEATCSSRLRLLIQSCSPIQRFRGCWSPCLWLSLSVEEDRMKKSFLSLTCPVLILENWGAIQYSLEWYPVKYREFAIIFVILFKMFSVLILTTF